ncbi:MULTISPECIES: shikimate dehydrogenase [Thermococcus]|uniref:Shikimate dehydrogenase (NADP(+)) n=1 Tax=Thermococcus sibiricus TaxID=172049 RepID=A0A101EM95_9EURY|nr:MULTISPECIES: shikimate dehydrogenase [Thermococcus]KUK17945.1 MAG: Shikimate dehydrogenase [Thermococcus sibiricus]KUK29314.1 MAG: Shikimate dehydrogenase [Thermococcus sp. 40_45]MBC7094618.1 shikimate dehydrogenase [Thermococcus sp.]HII67904.1 shikimate dehydrogenase [Thermococcaceae archaeon]
MIDAKTRLYGLIGKPVEHSLSPTIHNTLFRKYSINAVYLAFEVNDLESAVRGVQALGISGLNVTMPYKEQILEFLDRLSKEARAIGSVNTVINRGGKFIGYNTDGIGALKALKRFTEVENKNILVLGAGGAGKAIAYTLSSLAKVVVLNRTERKAKELEKFGVKGEELSKESLEYYLSWADAVINATSIGMNEDESPITKELLRKNLVVFDIVYSPLETKLIREAREVGCLAIDGLWMLIYQGAESFRLWTGIKPDVEFIHKVVLEALKGDGQSI